MDNNTPAGDTTSNTTAPEGVQAAPASAGEQPAYRTAAAVFGLKQPHELVAAPGLSHTPGLREVPNSTVPATATGEPVAHVYGPGQNPVDPVAAGLDTRAVLQTRAENRVVTQTGEQAAGPRPHTYIEKTGPDQVPQAAPADGALVVAPAETVADASPGPNSVAPAT